MVSETGYNSFASDSGLLLGIAEIRSRLAMQLVSETLESDSRIQLVWPQTQVVGEDFR